MVRRQASLAGGNDGNKENRIRNERLDHRRDRGAQASGGGDSKGNYIGSRRVSIDELQPQISDRSCEGGLAPGLRHEGTCADLFQVGAGLIIKGLQGITIYSRGNHS